VTGLHHHARGVVTLAVAALVIAGCGSDGSPSGDASPSSDASTESVPPTEAPPATDATESSDTSPSTDPADSAPAAAPSVDEGFAVLDPPTGEPIVIGMVNTEGTPGLDFPEMRTDTDLAVDYLNQHGGMGGRPIEIVHCAAAGSPETSQACAQELAGKNVEMVMLGLDLFPGYDTFAASGIPVTGALPVLSGDYTADALFISGGNATTMAAMVALADLHFEAESVGIVSADNVGANGSEATLTAALDKAGISYVSIKGGDNETDAGFQGLMRQANEGDPDVLISLYSDAGCIGAMRGRTALGITTPVITTPLCASSEVIDVVGDDAVGWNFVAIGSTQETPATADFAALIEPGHGDASATSLGVGALGVTQVMTLARVANSLAADGGEVTGATIHAALAAATDIRNFPNDNLLACGSAPDYPSICSFEFPIGEYVEGGEIRTIPGFEAFSVVDYLP
jgi:branched-chain amino acid transport system substrate-binding protein